VLQPAHISSLKVFIDTLGDLVDGTVKEANVNTADFIRKLSSRPSTDFGDDLTDALSAVGIL
jgi:hypothetical protein